VAPRPEGESLARGRLIAADVAAGRAPRVVILTDGAGSHSHSSAYGPVRLRTVRADEARAAVAHLGLPPARLVFLEEPDTSAPHDGPRFAAVVAKLLRLVRREAACTAILAPWRHDPHCDHEAAALTAAAAAEAAGIGVLAYPVWGWTLSPDTMIPGPAGAGWRLDISAFLPVKRNAIRAHQSQFGRLITDDPTRRRFPSDMLPAFERP
jgi:LmbE family N-acetylglucosaminyl deacetylase